MKIYLTFLLLLSIKKIALNGVYKIFYKDLFFSYENQTFRLSESIQFETNSFFRINKLKNKGNISYFSIEHTDTNLKLISSSNNKIDVIYPFQHSEYDKWKFLEYGNSSYKIQNINECFIKIINLNIVCLNITLEEATSLLLLKIYNEVLDNASDNELIEKEPIDILIKYIDLRDPVLKREGIHQIQKDYDNEELRYSIRSILKNIPWIRKIFILMPNDKVRFLKEYSFIKDKIVYVKDKDFLGYDSSNSLAFQFRYWKMEKFGISNNFIAMDDDCFIGKPLKKKDFFYVKNGTVTPALITSNLRKISKTLVENKLTKYKNIINRTNNEQTSAIFKYSLYLSYLFIINIFNESLYLPIHTHNAIPLNLKEIKEIYNLIYQSKYKNTTLDCLYRHIETLQFQCLILSYTFIKYNKRVNNIPYKLIQNQNSYNEDYSNYSLFCINTGSLNYSIATFMISKIVMQYLFPIPSPYEIIEYDFSQLSYKTIVRLMNKIQGLKNIHKKNIEELKNKLMKYQYKLKNFILFIALIFFKIMNYLRYIYIPSQ